MLLFTLGLIGVGHSNNLLTIVQNLLLWTTATTIRLLVYVYIIVVVVHCNYLHLLNRRRLESVVAVFLVLRNELAIISRVCWTHFSVGYLNLRTIVGYDQIRVSTLLEILFLT